MPKSSSSPPPTSSSSSRPPPPAKFFTLKRLAILTILTAVLPACAFFLFPNNSNTTGMSLAAIRSRHAAKSLAGKVAVVVGGTSGIGAGIAVRLAEADASVVIVGRSKERADEVLAYMRSVSKSATHSFISCDAALIKNVVQVSDGIKATHSSLDYLVLTQSLASMDGRRETSEGLDTKLSLHYYSRVAFVKALAPLLEASEDARVLSVLSGGVHSPFAGYATDPELKTTYSLINAANAAGFYNDIAVDRLAAEHPRISFTHAAPGMVKTRWGSEFNVVLKGLVRFLQLFARSAADCAEYMSCALMDDDYKAGAFHIMGADGQHVRTTALHDEARDKVWAHTQEVLQRLM